jgi:Flp pilus assembly protein TadD
VTSDPAGARLAALRGMLARRPDEPRLLFGLAVELLNQGATDEGVEHLRRYLALADDEGNAWGRLAAVLAEQGRTEEAREAYRTGIERALAHGHPTMAEEFEEALDAL